MSKTKNKFHNNLVRYRERLGFTVVQLALITGCTTRSVYRMEEGHALPGILTAFKLSAALRVPVEFLYQQNFEVLREQVRTTEERMPKGRQGVLPLPA